MACAIAITVSTAGVARADTIAVYDNTNYQGVDIGHNSRTAQYLPNKTCTDMYLAGKQNDKTYFQTKLQAWWDHGSNLGVLDCEDLFLNASTPVATAAYRTAEMLRLQTWAREIFPNKPIGWYGLANHIGSQYYHHYRDLLTADTNTVLLPQLHSFGANTANWDSRADLAQTQAADINTGLADPAPAYAYLWPQYPRGSNPESLDLTWIPGPQWSHMLEYLKATGWEGFVVWGGWPISQTCDATCQSEAPNKPWLPITQDFLDAL